MNELSKDPRSSEEITEENRLKRPLTFQDQITYIENNILLSPGHQESTESRAYIFLQELAQRLSIIKTNTELDPDSFVYSIQDWEKLEQIIEAKILQLNLRPEEFSDKTDIQASHIIKQNESKNDLGLAYRKLRKTMDSIKAMARPNT